MKNKLMALGIACFIVVQLCAQNNIPPKTTFVPPTVTAKLTSVSAVSIVQDSISTVTRAGAGSYQMYHFKGIIKSKGPGPINYRWAIMNTSNTTTPSVTKDGVINPGGTGTDTVSTQMANGALGTFKITLIIISPDQLSSNSISY